jgi:hypothetical protein
VLLRIVKRGTRWCVANFTPRPHILTVQRGNDAGWPQTRYGRSVEEGKGLLLPGIEPRFLRRPVRALMLHNSERDASYHVVVGPSFTEVGDFNTAWVYWYMRTYCFGLHTTDCASKESYGIGLVRFEASLLLPGRWRQHIAPKLC